MTPFADSSRRAQLLRLRRLATGALKRWGPTVRQVTLLTYWENATWRVDADEGRFLLRVHRPGYRTAAQILAELQWLMALREAGLEVQQPRATPDGRWLVEGSDPAVPEPRNVTLLSWIDGRFRDRSAGPAHCRSVGELMARLHLVSESWRPDDWDRPHLDERGPYRLPVQTGVAAIDDLLTEAEWADWTLAGEQLQNTMRALGKGPSAYGPIHADLHFNNIVFRGHAALPIDFDDASWGYYACDAAIPVGRMPRMPKPEVCLAAFWEGYAAVREPPSLDAVDTFNYCDAIGTARWVAARLDTPEVRERAPDIMARCTARIRRWLERR